MKHLPKVLLALTILLWGYAGWKTLALASGRLGPVTMTWRNVQAPHAYFAWSPNVTRYHFDQRALVLKPGQTATLLIRHFPHFTQGRIQIMAPGFIMGITLPGNSEISISGDRKYDTAPNVISFRWEDLQRNASGYPITIRNTAPTESMPIQQIKLTLQP